MTIEFANLPFKHNGLDDNIDMETMAVKMNAIEPGAGKYTQANFQETATQIVPQISSTDGSMTALTITIALIACSVLSILYFKSRVAS